MHSFFGHVSINSTYAVLTLILMIKRIIPYLHQDITYECIRAYYPTVDSDEEDVILRKKGTVESEYDNHLDDGDD
jgi:hypothetical protein